MKPKKILSIAIHLLIPALICIGLQAAPVKRKQAAKKVVKASVPNWQNLIRQAKENADAAQAEAQRVREQTAMLQAQLDAQAQEIAKLKEMIADLKTEPSPIKDALANTEGKSPAINSNNVLNETSAESSSATSTSKANTQNSEYEERLSKVEEQIQVNTAQIKEQAQTKVESDSRFRVKLYGMVLVNAYLNTNDSAQRSAPQYAPAPGWAYSYGTRNSGATLRQTTIGLLMNGARLGDKLGNARVSAETELDFYGGSADDYGAVLGQLRLRTASVRLDWERTSFVAGLREPMISPRNPSSLAAVYYPALADAGNLWQWRPQIYAEHRWRTGESSEIAVQGGIFLPFGETVEGLPNEKAPAWESRIAYSRNLANEKQVVWGFGGYIGQRNFQYGRKVNSYALTTDWLVPLGSKFEFSGEAFFGRAVSISEQSGAKIDRHFVMNGSLLWATTQIRGVHELGGWAQLTYRPREALDFNLAWGREDPRNRDLRDGLKNAATRFRNETLMTNVIYQLRSNVLLSLEYRRLWTDYAARRQVNGHYNLAVAYVF